MFVLYQIQERNLTMRDKKSWGRERMDDRLPAADRKMSAIKRRSSILKVVDHTVKKGSYVNQGMTLVFSCNILANTDVTRGMQTELKYE